MDGIDVSEHQGVVDWRLVAGEVSFAVCKAWETRADHRFAENWAGIAAAGLVRGAYVFGRPAVAAGRQMADFLDVVGPFGPGDLPPILDLETLDGHSPEVVIRWALDALGTLEATSGRTPILYTYLSFLAGGLRADPRLARFPLWIAAYQSTPPVAAWPWTIWQHSSTGTVAGIAGPVDLDRADPARFPALFATTSPPPAPPAPPTEETDVRRFVQEPQSKTVWLTDGLTRRRIATMSAAMDLAFLGLGQLGKDGKPHPIPHEVLADIPVV